MQYNSNLLSFIILIWLVVELANTFLNDMIGYYKLLLLLLLLLLFISVR